MALAYTAPTWVNGSGTGISASQLQALSDCMEGLVQGSDKAITNIAISGQTITLTFADGSQETGTASGLKGISSIAKTGTSGLVDTYTITFTDGSTTTFTVTNGAQGEAGPQGPQGPQGIQGPAGDDGVSPEVTITTITGGHRVNITDADHPSGQNFDVMDGQDGASDWSEITNKPNFATVATSGSYNDLGNKPSIPAAQVNSDWNAASGVAQILNKPTIPSITNCYQTTDTEETALANADYVPFYDISASAKRKISWSNIKSVLKTYFDTLYSKVVANPSGTATGTLTKLGIGSDIYDIQGGGGSSDKANKTDIAPVENGTTASRAYSIGQQFYLNGSLYKAKAAIAQGDTFTIGTNCAAADCITEQIKASLFPLISEMTTPGIVNNNRVKDVVGGYKQIGKTVYVDVSCTVNITMDNTSMVFPMINGWGILYNLPVPAHEVEFSCNYMKVKTGGYDRMYASAAIRDNGYLYLDFAGFSAVSGDIVHIRGTYEAN